MRSIYDRQTVATETYRAASKKRRARSLPRRAARSPSLTERVAMQIARSFNAYAWSMLGPTVKKMYRKEARAVIRIVRTFDDQYDVYGCPR